MNLGSLGLKNSKSGDISDKKVRTSITNAVSSLGMELNAEQRKIISDMSVRLVECV